jgi:propanediol dehydratase small subunit
MRFDPASDYPLGERRPDLVSTPSGLGLEQVTLEALRARRLRWDDVRATAETLHRQAEIALAAGRPALAANLARAAELASLPDETVLEIYSALRPHRSTADELAAWGLRLQELAAPLCAAFVREAAEVYAVRGLLAEERAAV